MQETHLDKFKKLLAELFMFDQADLDFGIYRIMNAKRDEITKFLDSDLLPQVREALGELEQTERSVVEAELTKAIELAKALGADVESLPKVKELRQKLAQKADIEALESEVFSDLYSFFRRYYNEGDFLSLRRYKEGVYAIPYEGEEVKLHWANADQYYIKTSEYFRDYTFKLPDGRRVHFKLAEADTDQNNNKPASGQERRFIIREAEAVAEENGDLVISFEYRPDLQKRKQSDLNARAAQRIFETQAARDWLAELARKAPTEKNPDRTLLDKQVAEYTARNTFDYFIHKDLSGFLKRELDFYIKNEVMHLDDIESGTAPRVEQYLAKVKAIRRIAYKIIDFVAQLEDFQKKLWLKKKFVVERTYCIALDRIPEEMYPEIAANGTQREEWVRLFAIDEIKRDLTKPGFSVPVTVDFLKAHPTLLLDTRHFSPEFTDRLLSAIPDLDEMTDGLLVHSENFQALRCLSPTYRGRVEFVYIDPPYNTAATPILYKNDYKESSWLSLLENRLAIMTRLLANESAICIAIDDTELDRLSLLLRQTYVNHELFRVVVNHYPGSGTGRSNVTRTHEYSLWVIPAGLDLLRGEAVEAGERERNFRRSGTGENNYRIGRANSFYAVLVDSASRRVVGVEPPPTGDDYPRGKTNDGYVRIYPIGEDGSERVWTLSYEAAEAAIPLGVLRCTDNMVINRLYNDDERRNLLPSLWADTRFGAVAHGTNLLKDLFGVSDLFSYPKSLYTVDFAIEAATHAEPNALILDYFAGSGTTGHAAIYRNRQDGGHRKFILVESGNHFESVVLPRLKKVTFTPEWKDGKPMRMATNEEAERGPHVIKVLRLESYEDTLNNLELKRMREQGALLDQHAQLREDYVLRYMLDVESKDSASLLELERFEDPFSYRLNVSTGTAGETRLADVDLVETFNWLLGLRVKHIDVIRGFRVVQGTNQAGEKVLVLWRNTREKSNADLDEFFLKQGYNTRDMEFDLIYVNGDNNLENLKRPDETWKVRLIEEEFKNLMFDVEDV